MIVGGGTAELLHRPLIDWLRRLDPDQGRHRR
jgi:hypothetical protein